MSRYKAEPNRLEKLQEAAKKRVIANAKAARKAKRAKERIIEQEVKEFRKKKMKERPEKMTDDEFFSKHFRLKGYRHHLDPLYKSNM